MEQEKIDRINELAKKAREEGLTEEETLERQALRKEYVSAHKESLKAALENVYVLDENGNKTKLKKKDEN